MLDFLFFDRALAQRFAQQAQQLGGEVRVETVEAGEQHQCSVCHVMQAGAYSLG